MKVVIGVESLRAPYLTGVGHYTRNLIFGLQRAAAINTRYMANGQMVGAPLQTPAAPLSRSGALDWLKRAAIALPGVQQVRAIQLAQTARRQIGHAIYHEPNHVLRLSHQPSIVTVHDLSVIHYPNFHPRDRVKYFERYFAVSLREADRIIVPSNFTCRDLVQTMGINPTKIRVIPMGVDAMFRPLSVQEMVKILGQYNLVAGRYVLALATREPRKNLERLLDAYVALPRDLRERHKLALAGPPGWQSRTLDRRLAELSRNSAVCLLGYVPDHARPALYNGAALFAYPSLYEGFGLPPLEALACGTPVLTSPESPMGENFADFVELADPLDVPAMTRSLTTMLTNTIRSRQTAQSGAARVAKFSWQACVEQTIALYREVA